MAHEILEGIRILDMTLFQLGPVNGMMLAQMGADVIKIEPPEGEPGRVSARWVKGSEGKGPGGPEGIPLSSYYENNNRLKRSLVLDLNKPKAREVLHQLVAKSDVFMQNYRHGVAIKLGAGYEELKKYNPKLIYYNGTSFGTKGPDSSKPGMDGVGRARSGWMYQTANERGEPTNAGGGWADQIGAIIGAFTIEGALYARERFGIGQECETSHFTACMWLQNCGMQGFFYQMLPKQYLPDPREKTLTPLSNFYKCKDGIWILLVNPRRVWEPLAEGLGMPESLIKDPRFTTESGRMKNARECLNVLDDYFARKTFAEHIKAFEGKDIMWEKVQRWEDLPTDPQIIANKYMTDYTHPLTGLTYKYQQLPMQYSVTSTVKMGRAPLLGEHTEEILVNLLGYKKEEVPKLLDEIGRPKVPQLIA